MIRRTHASVDLHACLPGFLVILACVAVLGLSGCGASIHGVLYWLVNQKDDKNLPAAVKVNSPPGASIVPLSGTQSADVAITYRLFDGDGDTLSVDVLFSPNGGTSFLTATEAVDPLSEGFTGLSASPGGITHVFVWDSAADLGAVVNNQVQIRIMPSDTEAGTPATMPSFAVDNNIAPSVIAITPVGTQNGSVSIDYQIADPESDLTSISIEYSTDGGTTYNDANEGSGGDGQSGLVSSPAGVSHVFVWDSFSDLGFVSDTTVRVRIIPSDTKEGVGDTTSDFTVNNNEAPIALLTTPVGEQSDGITIAYRLFDSNSDSIDITVEYTVNGSDWYEATPGGGSEPTSGLSSSPTGITHIFIWDSLFNLGQTYYPAAKIRITPGDTVIGSPASTDSFPIANNQAPIVFAQTPTGIQSGNVIISYVLLDAESDVCSILVQYSDDGGLSFYDATMGTGGDGTTPLASSPGGTAHTYLWDSDADLPSSRESDIQIRIIPNDGYRDGMSGTTANFQIDTTIPPAVSVVTPAATQTGNTTIDYTLTDAESDSIDILVEYSIDNWGTSDIATKASGGDPVTGLTSSTTGEAHAFIWETLTDLGYSLNNTVQVRITPSDTKTGSPDTTTDFVVDNNEAPTASIVTPAFEESAEVTISYTLFDSNSDTIDTVVKYSTDSGSSWSVVDATEVPGLPSEGTSGLSSSPTGTVHTFVWNSLADIGAVYSTKIRVKITPSDSLAGSPGETNDFTVNNNDAPSLFALTPSGIQTDDVSISYVLIEPESESCDVAVFYSEDSGASWSPAAMGAGGDGTTNLTGSPGGTGYTYVWDSAADIIAPNAHQNDIKIRIIPSDPYRSGSYGQTGDFEVDNTTPPWVTVTNPGSPKSANVTIDYTLYDADSEVCSTVVEFTTGSGWFEAAQAGGDPTTGLASSPAGIAYSFVWDTVADNVGTGGIENADFRITPADTQAGSPDSVNFDVDNTGGVPWAEIVTPSGEQTGDVTISYTLYDPTSESIDSYFQYSTDNGTSWTDAADSPYVGETSSPGGTAHTFIWDSISDIGDVYNQKIKIRVQPYDGGNWGDRIATGAFTVNNNDAPWVIVVAPVGQQTADVTISYDLYDNESDFCSIYVEFSDDGGNTFSGPATQGTGGDGITGLDSLPAGKGHTFVWNSLADIGSTWQTDIRIRITPSDPYRAGTQDATGNFEINNATISVWNGSVDDVWTDPANWDGGVPGSTKSVLIPAGKPHYPKIVDNTAIGALVLENGTALILQGAITFDVADSVQVDGAITMEGKSGCVTLKAGANLTVSSTGSISGDGCGQVGGGASEGEKGVSTNDAGGGGGHGGYGGAGRGPSNIAAGGSPYDSAVGPLLPGSSGGDGKGGVGPTGGTGGGAMKIEVAGTFTLDSVISSNGEAGLTGSTGIGGGGGSGGSIWVICDTLAGTGRFEANGGNGGGTVSVGGAGAGGRIAVYYSDASGFTGTLASTANPGFGWAPGAATYGFGSVIFVDDKGDADPLNDDLYVYQSSLFCDTSYSFADILIMNNAILALDSHSAGDAQIVMAASGDFTVEAGCKITGDYLGYVNGEGDGPGLPALLGNQGGGGGGHGGDGGDGDKNGGSKGLKYDDENAPVLPGSGGGDNFNGDPGGFGGAAIKLTASGTFTNNGEVRADGQDAITACGGGAGGSILIECDFLAGSGLFRANGGSTPDTGGGGGGGAGGRIYIECNDKNGWSGTVTVAKGLGKNDGQNGTKVGP